MKKNVSEKAKIGWAKWRRDHNKMTDADKALLTEAGVTLDPQPVAEPKASPPQKKKKETKAKGTKAASEKARNAAKARWAKVRAAKAASGASGAVRVAKVAWSAGSSEASGFAKAAAVVTPPPVPSAPVVTLPFAAMEEPPIKWRASYKGELMAEGYRIQVSCHDRELIIKVVGKFEMELEVRSPEVGQSVFIELWPMIKMLLGHPGVGGGVS